MNPVSVIALLIAAYWATSLVRTWHRPPEWRSPSRNGVAGFSRDAYFAVAILGLVTSVAVAVGAVLIIGPT